MRSVFAVIGVTASFTNGRQFDFLETPADGQDQQRVGFQPKFPFDRFFVESPDTDAVQPDLCCLQEHALCRDAQIDIDIAVFFDRRADDDKGIRFCARKG